MVYLYKKTINGRPYYYLRISKRINGKIVVKDIAYLGSDPSKIWEKLKEIPKIYKEEIRKAYRNINKFIQGEYYLKKIKSKKLKENPFINKNLLEEVEAIKLHFKNEFLKKDKRVILDTYENFIIDFAFNTTSLEGNTITLEEANKLFKENLTPKNRTLREIFDLQNNRKVFFETFNIKKQVSQEFIIQIHDSLLENIDVRTGYRNHDIRVFKSRFEPTPHPYLKTDMKLLIQWYKQNEKKLHPLDVAGIFHHKFEKIHPFSDGNGRTGRMTLSYMLLKKGYPPLIIRKTKRSEYLDAMEKADKAGIKDKDPKHYKTLIEFLAKELSENYWNNFNI